MRFFGDKKNDRKNVLIRRENIRCIKKYISPPIFKPLVVIYSSAQ